MMYKKIVIWGLISVGFLLGVYTNYGYAQEYTEADMKSILVRFCNSGTGEDQLKLSDTIYIEPNKKQELCLFISNAGDKKMVFEYGFSMGATSNAGDAVCDGDMGTGNNFSRLIPQSQERVITMEPMSSQTIKENIIIPPGMNGLQLGCLAYKLSKPQYEGVGGMFSLVVRKVTHLNIVIGGESTVNRTIKVLNMSGGIFSSNKKMKATINKENNLTLGYLIENQGNVSQYITITGKIYNALGFEKVFSTETKELNPGNKTELNIDVGILPTYKGLFNIKFNIKSDPVYLFPVTNEKLKQPGYVSETAKIFVFSWIRVIALIVILFIIYKVFIPKKAKTIIITK